jgi:S1-C subfamily serine protease
MSVKSFMIYLMKQTKNNAHIIKPHHRKPFRKRHLASIFLCSFLTVYLIVYSLTYQQPTFASASSSELNGAKYSPAVVKIYHFYCFDININGAPYLKDVCEALTGSGFIIGSEGQIATNGHVVHASARDLVINHALDKLFKGDSRYIEQLMEVANVRESDLQGLTKPEDIASAIIDRFYAIPDNVFTTPNSVDNLLVGLNTTTPDLEYLQKLTEQRKSYVEDQNIRSAKVLATDFRYFDGIKAWKQSDVSIIKINNKNLPVVKLGNIEGLTQGANLTILGFPGSAGSNGLVSEQSKVTLTEGKVSSIKNAKGSVKKLLETDTTIGSGNSGGPALDQDGNVVGLATYTVDQSGTGGGTFNYIRDIKDLKDLAQRASISIKTESETQTEWEKGINYFYDSRYSKALKSFEKVKETFPQHSRVGEFTTLAKTHIDRGEDKKDFPIIPILISLFVLTTGFAVSVFLFFRHRKNHRLYQQEASNLSSSSVTENNVIAYNAGPVQAPPTSIPVRTEDDLKK